MTSTVSRSTRTRSQHPAARRPWPGGLNLPALVTATAGTVLVVVAMLSVTWYEVAAMGASWSAQDLTGQVAELPGAFPGAFPVAYFGWIAWALLGAAVVATVLASTRIAHRVRYAIGGAVLALGGLAATIAATISGAVTLAHTLHQPVSAHGFFTVTQAGAWVAAAGFLVLAIAAIAAAVSSRRAMKTAQPAT